MVRLPIVMPRLSNSPLMRAAPHRRFSAAIRLINATVSSGTCGLFAAVADVAPHEAIPLPMPAQQRVRLHKVVTPSSPPVTPRTARQIVAACLMTLSHSAYRACYSAGVPCGAPRPADMKGVHFSSEH